MWLQVTELGGRVGILEPTLLTDVTQEDHVHSCILVFCLFVFLITKTLDFYSGFELSVEGDGKRA